MALLDKITEKILQQIDGSGFQQKGAYNLRHNGVALWHGDSEHIKIKKRKISLESIFTLMGIPEGNRCTFR